MVIGETSIWGFIVNEKTGMYMQQNVPDSSFCFFGLVSEIERLWKVVAKNHIFKFYWHFSDYVVGSIF